MKFPYFHATVSASCEGIETVVADGHGDVRTDLGQKRVKAFPVLDEKHPVIGVKIVADYLPA